MIQDLINQANPGDTVHVPRGSYDVDAINSPIWLKPSITLDLTEATINVIPNDANDRVYFPIGISNCQDVNIVGGLIQGDRLNHQGTTAAGFGHGIAIGGGSHNIKIQNSTVRDCEGDGIIIVDASAVEVSGVTSQNNRRQGLTSSQVDGLWVHNCKFLDTNGAAPSAGIDLEADLPTQIIKNVRIENSLFAGNQGAGVLIATPPAQRSNIHIINNTFMGKPIDGTDGIVPFYAKWLYQVFGKLPGYDWWYYPIELNI